MSPLTNTRPDTVIFKCKHS